MIISVINFLNLDSILKMTIKSHKGMLTFEKEILHKLKT